MKNMLNKIHLGDCLEFMKTMPDKSVDLILTDPPYFGIVKDSWDNQWKNIFDFQKWVGELARKIKLSLTHLWAVGQQGLRALQTIGILSAANLTLNITDWQQKE